MTNDPILPGRTLRIVIRNNAPVVFYEDCPSYRSVSIELTDEQLSLLRLERTHTLAGTAYHEEISRCFLEPAT
jgi:hypothetical protein